MSIKNAINKISSIQHEDEEPEEENTMPDTKKGNVDSTRSETLLHIAKVQHYLNVMIAELLLRGEQHDQCKLSPEELGVFTEYTAKLKTCTYGSDEYKSHLAAMKPALDHHYANSRHHPEHYKNGVSDMTLVDLMEMFCDWKAASLRQLNGNILKSIEQNTERFEISPQLRQILENTAKKYGD